jgi:cytochrome c biogenesis protein
MKQIIFKILADLRFAITILLIIALTSIVGTIIEQDQSIDIYKLNYPLNNRLFGVLSWDIILKFGFDHVYTTWWFICFILLFGISLITCTFIQQIPALKIARRCQFLRRYKQFCKLKISKDIAIISLGKLCSQIQKNQYSIFQQKNLIYCYKGIIGKIAPISVHLSIILILLGSIVSALFGFKAQEIAPKTETVHIQNVLFNGPFSKIPTFSTRINDFWITYTKSNTINQYYSDISIIDNLGTELQQQTIFVNEPAKVNTINYYQTDWNLLGLRVKLNNLNLFQYPLISISILNQKSKIWISWISNSQTLKDGFAILMNDLEGYCSIYDSLGLFLGNLELNEIFDKNFSLILVDIISSVGLQIKIDPGITFIYVGFAFLMISTLLSYITYSQIWILQDLTKIVIGGTTTRAKFDFELEFLKLIKPN